MTMLSQVKSIVRHNLVLMRLARGAVYDFTRFSNYAAIAPRFKNQSQFDAILVKEYHKVEKGLSLPSPRRFFGQPVLRKVLRMLDSEYGRASAFRDAALGSIAAYVKFHEQLEPPEGSAGLLKALGDLRGAWQGTEERGGVQTVRKADITRDGEIDFGKFVRSRHSVREFEPGVIPISTFEQCVTEAMYAPSVCNRQSARCYLIQDKSVIDRALALQNGNRGFSDQIENLVIVTSDLSAFNTSGERYQSWIDGGMFAMALVFALHSRGIGSCCLNWSQNPDADKALRARMPIADADNVIMYIAVGELRDEFEVCRSMRKPLTEVLKEI